ncbi:transposase for insertion sequence element IS1086 [Paenibacillus sp. FSL R5-192]|nr:transposase for insertion sequence element IS1086 [Paenibacillus sp. FSL R5-192]
MIERKTRLSTAVLMPDHTAMLMEIALGIAISQYFPGTFLTATAERGKEFACYAILESTHNLFIFC